MRHNAKQLRAQLLLEAHRVAWDKYLEAIKTNQPRAEQEDAEARMLLSRVALNGVAIEPVAVKPEGAIHVTHPDGTSRTLCNRPLGLWWIGDPDALPSCKQCRHKLLRVAYPDTPSTTK